MAFLSQPAECYVPPKLSKASPKPNQLKNPSCANAFSKAGSSSEQLSTSYSSVADRLGAGQLAGGSAASGSGSSA